MKKVLVMDGVAEIGLTALRREPDIEVVIGEKMSEDQLIEVIGDYEAMIVRSATKVTARVMEHAHKMIIVGRAGVGIDNIDVAAATAKGIIVVNAPDGNTIAATEHTIAMMMALTRNIPQAWASLKAGNWDKKSFMGVELREKVLGIIGFGRIGSAVAKRAQSFKMRVIVYDPYIGAEKAESFGVELVPLEELFKQADFITNHLPLTKESKYILGESAFAQMKKGVRIVNCARGGVVDEKALYEALKSGKIAGAALDVFEEEPTTESPLFELNNFIGTPHLGASTEEAQLNVAFDVALDIIAALKGEFAKNAVNIPSLNPKAMTAVKPYLNLAEKMGMFAVQVADGRTKEIELTYSGDLANQAVGPITTAALKGFLDVMLQGSVNFVNADAKAKARGINISERKNAGEGDYANLITLTVTTDTMKISVSGTIFAGTDARFVFIDDYHVDAIPEGHMLYVPHTDKPKIIGPAASLIGEHGINISGLQVGRKILGGKAVMLLNVDHSVPKEVLAEIAGIDGVLEVKNVDL
ncbi:MAG: phosphoglycerate dehydrogenase [Peptococcaceae bacterium]|nr:phosphoglycerate dehydrogenase [Peptococcaceae bacterium]